MSHRRGRLKLRTVRSTLSSISSTLISSGTGTAYPAQISILRFSRELSGAERVAERRASTQSGGISRLGEASARIPKRYSSSHPPHRIPDGFNSLAASSLLRDTRRDRDRTLKLSLTHSSSRPSLVSSRLRGVQSHLSSTGSPFLCSSSIMSGFRFLGLVRPFLPILPEVSAPDRKVSSVAARYSAGD